ncbi:MAG: hypothetical protein PME_36270 [Priestia megaterium]|uniref:hypothetical protein n=1 Tax=Priestia aryabhattai TaxID=412384 RepID=UPI001C8E56A6|nr:hypothetical protein [Priestia aryabhattai]MBX9983773.1 hypothetical protein [Priestia aryabhattai]MBY0003585.1 hypothetical protein [Priestia aryabhattai]
MHDIKFNYLTDLCSRYQQDKFFIEEIPLSILSKANKRFNISSEEAVVAFLDCTMFGSGKVGVYFTDNGIRWKNLSGESGNIEWTEFGKVDQITVQNKVEVHFDDRKAFLIGGGNTYPISLFIELLTSIRDFLNEYSYELLVKQHNVSSSVTYNDLMNISTLFEKYEEAFEPNNGLLVDQHIPSDLKKKITKYFNLQANREIVAFLCTFPLKKTDGIIIGENGIYFREAFVSLYYPWYVFRTLPLYLSADELIIGKDNIFHLIHAKMEGTEILLFLKKLQEYANSVYKSVPTVIDLYSVNTKTKNYVIY